MRLLLCLLMLLFAAPVLAADWQVSRVRGEVTQQIGGSWKTVSRGEAIPNDRYLRTGANGRLGLTRGNETIELQGDTQIRIKDAGARLMTTVLQDFGVVAVDVERRNVQHFSVQTPFLAAVVKGTRFTVRSDTRGATVDVSRGVVQVQDTVNDLVVDVRPGQEATVTSQAPLLVEGAGAVSVFNFKGVQVINGTTTTAEEAAGSDESAASTKTNNAGGNGNGNAFGLAKKAIDDTPGSASGTTSNAGGNGNGNAFGLSKNSSSGNNGSNGKSVGNAASNAASGAASRVTDTVDSAVSAAASTVTSVTETVTGNNGNGKGNNAGGNGVGNAFGLLK